MKFQEKKSTFFSQYNIIKIFSLFFLFNIFSTTKSSAQDFNSLIEDLIRQNPNIKSSYYNYLAYIDGKMSTTSDYLPQAAVNFNYNIQEIDKVSNSLDDNYETKEYDLEVTQKLFAPDAIASLTKAKLTREEAWLTYEQIKSETILDLINTIVTIKSLENQVLYEKNNTDLNENLFKVSQIKNQSGIISQIDLLRSKTEYLKSKTDYINIKKQLTTARSHYFTITGLEFDEKITLEQFINDNFHNLESIIQDSYRGNLELQILSNQLKQLKQNKKIEQSDYLPKADLFYSYNSTRGNYSYYTGNSDTNNYTTYGVKVSVPLFTSFKNTSDVKIVQNQILAQEHKMQNHTNLLKEEITRLWEELNVNKALITEHESYNEYAEQSYNATKKQYEARLKDITYLLDAQNTLLDARSKLNNTKAEMMKNYFQIIFLVGKLNEKLFIQLK